LQRRDKVKLCYSLRFPSHPLDIDVANLHMDASIPPVWQRCNRAINSAGVGKTNHALHCMRLASNLVFNLHSHAPAVEASSALHAAELFDALIKTWPRNARVENQVYVNTDSGAFAHKQGPNFILFHAAASRPFSFVATSAGLPDGFVLLQQARARNGVVCCVYGV
jgi:hypothetical protein